MKAIVLAAGQGKRLRPFTKTRPKHMIPIAGRPLLEHLLISLRENEVKEVVLVVGYLSEQIQNFLGDGSDFGMKIEYAAQDKIEGTASAIKVAKEYITEDKFLVVNGDLFVSTHAVKDVLSQTSSDEMIVSVVPVNFPERYGVVEIIGETIKNIVEKPSSEKKVSKLVNAGVYLFSRDVFRWINRTSRSNRQEYEITATIQNMMDNGFTFKPVLFKQNDWLDIGRPWDLLRVLERILTKEDLTNNGEIEKGVVLSGPIGIAKNTRIRSGTYVEGPVYIDSGSDIGPNCYIRPYTSIGSRCRIGNACEVKNSLLFEDTHVAHLSYIGDSVIGANCNFGAGTITANLRLDDASVKVRVKNTLEDSGLRKVGAFIGDDVKTAINVNLMPGVKIGSGSWIGPNTSVYSDIAPGKFILGKQDVVSKKVPK
jgi:bifunctional UDP-N-acetylglucosamine pyrophosphorylase/glucosamine-1-phosphate N-acetyltransferase